MCNVDLDFTWSCRHPASERISARFEKGVLAYAVSLTEHIRKIGLPLQVSKSLKISCVFFLKSYLHVKLAFDSLP
jgi:hypothetical protein